MRLSIHHTMRLTPAPGTTHAVLQLLLTPQSGATQHVENWTLEMAGIETAGTLVDAFGNSAHLVNQARPEGDLVITVSGVVETKDTHGVLGRPGGEPVPALFRRVTALTRPPEGIALPEPDGNRIDALHALMARIGAVLGSIEAQAASQTQMQADGAQSQAQSQEAARTLPPAGDYAHAFIGAARASDIPARYVTGYLLDGPDGLGGFHAWAEAYDDRLGWIGFDPMLQLCPTDRHVRLAVGLDAYGAQPVRAVPAGDGVRTDTAKVERVIA